MNLALAQAKSLVWITSESSLENHGLKRSFTLNLLQGACLSVRELKICENSAQASSGSVNRQILSKSARNKSCRKACSSKFLKFHFKIERAFNLRPLTILTQAVGQ